MTRALILATAAGAWAGLASGQCLSSIPECAQACLSNAATGATSCGAADYKCQCADPTWQTIWQGSENCLVASCGKTVTYGQCEPFRPQSAAGPAVDRAPCLPYLIMPLGSYLIDTVQAAAEAFCYAVNGGQACSSSSSSTTGGGTSTTFTSTTTTLTGSTPTTSGTTASITSSSTGTGTTGSVPSTTGTATAATAAASSSTAAAAVYGPIGSLGMIVLGALAFV